MSTSAISNWISEAQKDGHDKPVTAQRSTNTDVATLSWCWRRRRRLPRECGGGYSVNTAAFIVHIRHWLSCDCSRAFRLRSSAVCALSSPAVSTMLKIWV